MFRDFGSGLTVDELIGIPAFHISKIKLPPGEIFEKVKFAANQLVKAEMESFILLEIWEDGHTVWKSMKDDKPTLLTPSGQVIRSNQ